MVAIPAPGMAGTRSQTMDAMETKMVILPDLVRMAGIHTPKTQFGETMMTRTSE